MISTGKISTANHIASYIHAGDGDTAMILMHGNSMAKECFLPQFESGLSKACKLIAVDFPGHGDTISKNQGQPCLSR